MRAHKKADPAVAGAADLLEYGSKSIVSVIPGSWPAVNRLGLRKHPAKADDQATAQGELVGGLIGIDTAVIIVVIIEGSPCRPNRREELGF